MLFTIKHVIMPREIIIQDDDMFDAYVYDMLEHEREL